MRNPSGIYVRGNGIYNYNNMCPRSIILIVIIVVRHNNIYTDMTWFTWLLEEEKTPHRVGARGETATPTTLSYLSPSPRRYKPYILSYYLLQLAVTVDEVYGEQGSSAGAFTSLSLGYVYLGGSENTVALPGTKASSNFVGCIRKVRRILIIIMIKPSKFT